MRPCLVFLGCLVVISVGFAGCMGPDVSGNQNPPVQTISGYPDPVIGRWMGVDSNEAEGYWFYQSGKVEKMTGQDVMVSGNWSVKGPHVYNIHWTSNNDPDVTLVYEPENNQVYYSNDISVVYVPYRSPTPSVQYRNLLDFP